MCTVIATQPIGKDGVGTKLLILLRTVCVSFRAEPTSMLMIVH